MAVVSFHRKYMKHVFRSDELDEYDRIKQEIRAFRKKQKLQKQMRSDMASAIADPLRQNKTTYIEHKWGAKKKSKKDPLSQLEAYRASK